MTALQFILGMSHSNLGMYLRFGCRVIVETLKNDSLTLIIIPADEDIAIYQESVLSILLSRWTKTRSGASSVSEGNTLEETLCLKIMTLVLEEQMRFQTRGQEMCIL
jgi:hypothetical protein